MAHCVEKLADGSYSMAWNGEVPWHKHGKKIPADLTPEQILIAASCDWLVEKQQLFRQIGDGFEPTDSYALVRDRDNKILDYVSKNWVILQNSEAFGFFHDFVMAGDMEMHTAGSLKGGQIVWCLAKIKEPLRVFGKDVIQPYLLFTNPQKFGQSIDVRLTNTRVVCNNTLTMALGEKATSQVVKMSHRSKFDAEAAKTVLGIANHKNTKFLEAAQFLSKKTYTKDDAMAFFAGIYPKVTVKEDDETLSKNAKMALGIVDIQPGANIAPGSYWNLVNAITFLNSHELGRESDTRLYNQWFGSTQKQNIKALNLALEMAS
jgi:phage/plasmid-like protein (TIGR03299 family)